MEQKTLNPSYPDLREGSLLPASPQVDLIFVQEFGLVPRRIISTSSPAQPPVAERKWLGNDFSHVIVVQQRIGKQ